MGNYIVKMSREEIAGLTENDVAFIVMCHEADRSELSYATPPFHKATTIHVNGGIGITGLIIVLGPKQPRLSVNMPY